MTHGALFNGIAGFPLAAAWAGIPTTWTVEIDEFCNKVSKKHFPNAIQYTDIRAAKHLPYVDIISGGFPCQPFSVAGKQLAQEDDRHLWPEMLRVIREVKPAYVIGENVTGIISLALDEVLASLEAEGYTTETFIVPACGVGAPHRRDRVWIVAYSNSNRESNGPLNVNSRNRKLGPTFNPQNNRPERQPRRGREGAEWGMVPQRIGSGSESERGCETPAHTNGHDDQTGLDLGRNQSQTGGSRSGSNREIREADQRECFRAELGDNGSQWDAATPSTRDYKGTNNQSFQERGGGKKGEQLPNHIKHKVGIVGQLNPRFVMEMMGFPPDWCEIEQPN